jgi:hypothetical protein
MRATISPLLQYAFMVRCSVKNESTETTLPFILCWMVLWGFSVCRSFSLHMLISNICFLTTAMLLILYHVLQFLITRSVGSWDIKRGTSTQTTPLFDVFCFLKKHGRLLISIHLLLKSLIHNEVRNVLLIYPPEPSYWKSKARNKHYIVSATTYNLVSLHHDQQQFRISNLKCKRETDNIMFHPPHKFMYHVSE